MTRPITTAPADTARAMHAAEMRGQDMQDAPERIWAWQYMIGSLIHGKWSPYPDDVNDPPCSLSYTRTDLCVTEAECQRRIDAAVLAEREAWYAATSQQFGNLMAIHTEVKAAAIRALGQK